MLCISSERSERGDCMDDEQIIDLYFRRDERAIAETKKKYGAYCGAIARAIVPDALDCEECTNDTWFSAWRSIPPKRPSNLAAYLGKLTRNHAINCFRKSHAEKRRINEFAVSLDELGECVSGRSLETDDAEAIGACISAFLREQKPLNRRAFVCRYFYCQSIGEIAQRFSVSESHVKSLLFRMRGKLRISLEQNGITVVASERKADHET